MVKKVKRKVSKSVKKAKKTGKKETASPLSQLPDDYMPLMAWYHHFYNQQMAFTLSPAWIRAFIAGNGTGKSQIIHANHLTIPFRQIKDIDNHVTTSLGRMRHLRTTSQIKSRPKMTKPADQAEKL